MTLLWTLGALLFIAQMTSVQCSSGDGGDWGSGSMPELIFTSTSTSVPKAVRDKLARPGSTKWTKPLFQVMPEEEADDCSVQFHTSQTLSRQLRMGREDVAYLKTLQHGNQAVLENLIQYVGAEMGEKRYEEVVQENIAGINDNHAICDEVVKKAHSGLVTQLEGDIVNAPSGLQKIEEESLAFEEMLRSTAQIANRLELSARTLHMQLTEQLKKKSS